MCVCACMCACLCSCIHTRVCSLLFPLKLLKGRNIYFIISSKRTGIWQSSHQERDEFFKGLLACFFWFGALKSLSLARNFPSRLFTASLCMALKFKFPPSSSGLKAEFKRHISLFSLFPWLRRLLFLHYFPSTHLGCIREMFDCCLGLTPFFPPFSSFSFSAYSPWNWCQM